MSEYLEGIEKASKKLLEVLSSNGFYVKSINHKDRSAGVSQETISLHNGFNQVCVELMYEDSFE